MTKMQFKQNTSEKLDFWYCGIASKFLETKLESWTVGQNRKNMIAIAASSALRKVGCLKKKRFPFFAVVKGVGVDCGC